MENKTSEQQDNAAQAPADTGPPEKVRFEMDSGDDLSTSKGRKEDH
ncbi:hypothetical protein [Achromobacter dolens]